jgi:hypothetical protein
MASESKALKPLLIVLVLAVVVGLAYYALVLRGQTNAEGEIPGVLKPPADYKPMTPEELSKMGGPSPTGGGGG